MLVNRAGIHKTVVRGEHREDPELICFKSSLIWACTACLGFFGRQLEFEILEHLQVKKIINILLWPKIKKIPETHILFFFFLGGVGGGGGGVGGLIWIL